MQNETITLDPSKNYLQSEPFFICSADGKQVEILRMANEGMYGETVTN